jgi:hypothetical protein
MFLFVGMAGAFAVPPFAIYLLLVRWWRRPITEGDYRRVSLTAPIGSGVILAVLASLTLPLRGLPVPGVRDFLLSFGWLTNAALIVGYAFVGVVELRIAAFKRKHSAVV